MTTAIGSQPTSHSTANPEQPCKDLLLETIDKVAKKTETIRGVIVILDVYLYQSAVIAAEDKTTESKQSPLNESGKTDSIVDGLAKKWREEEEIESKKEYQLEIATKTYSQESLDFCEKNHQTEDHRCMDMGWQGTWQDAPPKGLERFPSRLPLAMFIKKDGKFVEHGDKIKFERDGKRVVLTVCHKDKPIDGQYFACFSRQLEAMVKLSETIRYVMLGAVAALQQQIVQGTAPTFKKTFYYDGK